MEGWVGEWMREISDFWPGPDRLDKIKADAWTDGWRDKTGTGNLAG